MKVGKGREGKERQGGCEGSQGMKERVKEGKKGEEREGRGKVEGKKRTEAEQGIKEG